MFRKSTVIAAAVAALLGGAALPAVAAPSSHSASAQVQAEPSVVDVTASNLEQVLEMSNRRPVVLNFTATWCPPCKQMKPYLQQYNTADKGTWVWARVDADANRAILTKYGVKYLPTLLNIRNGKEAGSRMVGYDGPQALRTWLNNL
ncbi:thioredoxin family protein [Streptomyces zagrosensis]|uniref:Putative thioredoxin n=1 Tax=Streptomyces zagrosensis TaxID=1042984 RepID=A0A7W9UZK3_9ACTN|nr:thioredoxin family protein [Streptomyces zagrosensis]MBB5935864.1 putative thioredoxin [Streptomyces zagrosensis]